MKRTIETEITLEELADALATLSDHDTVELFNLLGENPRGLQFGEVRPDGLAQWWAPRLSEKGKAVMVAIGKSAEAIS